MRKVKDVGEHLALAHTPLALLNLDLHQALAVPVVEALAWALVLRKLCKNFEGGILRL